MNPIGWRSVLLKLSGEVLGTPQSGPLASAHLPRIAGEIAESVKTGTRWAVLTGGGNIQRGSVAAKSGGDRILLDQVGMLATTINALAFANALSRYDCPVEIYNSVAIPGIADVFCARAARKAWNSGHVLLFGGGTGHPFFSTDTAAVLRALEIGADVLLKGTKVAGVFSRDPNDAAAVEPAEFYPWISYDDILSKKLAVMDMTAIALCQENQLPLLVFDITEPGSLRKIFLDPSCRTLVSERRSR